MFRNEFNNDFFSCLENSSKTMNNNIIQKKKTQTFLNILATCFNYNDIAQLVGDTEAAEVFNGWK